MSNVAPIFLPLWSSTVEQELQFFLNHQKNLALSSQIALDPVTLKWSVSSVPTENPFGIKLLDAIDLSKAFLSYGGLTGDDAFLPKIIIERMRNNVMGVDKLAININNLANTLLEFLPPEVVSMLLVDKKGTVLIEMPYETPFPMHSNSMPTPKVTPSRLGLLIMGERGIVSPVWRPNIEGSKTKERIIWTPDNITTNEFRAIHRMGLSADYEMYTLPTLGGAFDTNGKIYEQESPLFGYVHKNFPGAFSNNYHERRMTLASISQVLSFATVAHKQFQHAYAMDVLRSRFGSCSELVANPATAMANRQLRYETPWNSKQEMHDTLALLPDAESMISDGVLPFFALEKTAGYTNHAQSKLNSNDHEEVKSLLKTEIEALSNSGMTLISKKAFNRYPFQADPPHPLANNPSDRSF